MKCSLGISNFLEEISRLSHSIVFFYFFALITEERFLISSCYLLELCIQLRLSFLFSFAFHFSSFHSCLYGLLRQQFCLFTFLFLGDGLDHCLLYSVTNLHSQFIRHSVYQIRQRWLMVTKLEAFPPSSLDFSLLFLNTTTQF